MVSFFVSFLTSALLTLLIIKHDRLQRPALDSDFGGVQKVHVHDVARLGGLPIFLAILVGALVGSWRVPGLGLWFGPLLACSVPAFGGGLVEDFTGRVSASRRLLLTMLAAAVAWYWLDARLLRLDLPGVALDMSFWWLSLPITVLAVAGIANAVNIIDGFNGLASMVCICMLISLAYVAAQVGDVFILVAALSVAGATAGFLIWNYPAGLIFLGDGGAYLIGFLLGELALCLVMRHAEISTWYAVLLLLYPAFETLFSVYRRLFIKGRSPAVPDGIHLHGLIFRRIVQWAVGPRDAKNLLRQNSLTSPYLWLLSGMAVLPATIFWRSTPILIGFSALFVISYVWLYGRIVRFKSPKWLMLRKRDKTR
ncbi:glycosyltransferase [Massilia sp. TS11]|uniref:MraY family glycosyltransferase n=1 Tax=Massilia sp. TS11 TaxID=2908003 RepID=UPI001EDBB50D|nr:glycosyltransferase [Massilia sp. TS11]MCG2583473.1 glycosyltransferase [Massilia sp. TS11]